MNSIKIAREKAGLSQAALGELIGYNQATVCRIENGQQRVCVDQVKDIADALGVPVSRLLKQQAA